METPMKFLVTANHPVPKYALSQAEVEVQTTGQGRYYVSLSPYGCSKDYGTPTDAIVCLLADNGCTAISIKTLPLTYSDDMSLEDGLLLARQYDDKAEAGGAQVFRIDYDPAYWRETHGFSSGKELWDYLEGAARS